MTAPTRIWTDVDYDKPGKQIGWLNKEKPNFWSILTEG